MECASSEHRPAETRRRKGRVAASLASASTSRLLFADEVRRELDPRGRLDRLAVDQVIQAAWALQLQLEKAAPSPSIEAAPSTSSRVRATALEKASRSFREAIESLDLVRSCLRIHRVIRPLEAGDFAADSLSNEWPLLPEEFADDAAEEGSGLESAETPRWQERLVFDFDVSDASPVVKGTWVTAGHVVSLIVDGWSWADVLRSYPELCEEDIRTCVAYAMAEDIAAP